MLYYIVVHIKKQYYTNQIFMSVTVSTVCLQLSLNNIKKNELIIFEYFKPNY